MHGYAHQRGWRVEGAALLEAQRFAVALGDLAGRVGNGAFASALLDQVESACEGAFYGLLQWFAMWGDAGVLGRTEPCDNGWVLGKSGFGFNAHPNSKL